MGINKERTDARGRATGSYLMSTKGNVTQSDKESLWTFLFQGIKYFGGGSSPREPHRWSHVCLGVRYTAAGTAERTIFADGEHNFNFTSAFLPASSWPRSRSFTFGGREVETRYTSMTIILTTCLSGPLLRCPPPRLHDGHPDLLQSSHQ